MRIRSRVKPGMTRMKNIIDKKTPAISVIMPAHNAADFIAEAIESILEQSFSDFELIIINDGSTDKTYQIAKEYALQDKKIKVISYRKNKGESAAANLGFKKAKGKYIARMDADDIAHKDRLSKQISFLEKNKDYILVGSQANIIDEFGNIIGQKTFSVKNQDIYAQYGILHPVLHPSIMIRRSLLPKQDKLWAEQAEPNDDYFTLFTLLKRGKFYNLPEKLMSYRMHENNKSMQNIKKKFINSLKIRAYAVIKLDYPLYPRMILNALIQSIIVLSMPEWLTSGLFLWIKGMKPFDKAFPQTGVFKKKLRKILKNSLSVQPEYAFPIAIALVIQSLFFRKSH